jgi:hypothetical protein
MTIRDNDIILLVNSKYKRRFVNVIFLQDKHNINTESKNIKVGFKNRFPKLKR